MKSKGDYFIVLNPGIIPDKNYFDIADNIVVLENNISAVNEVNCSYSDKSSIIVYGAQEFQMEEIVKKYNCEYVYVTDDSLPNPYDTLPSYFEEEINALK
ncbi:MAG: spherulation-specific family 4 protein [Nautiliaceae bacterium]